MQKGWVKLEILMGSSCFFFFSERKISIWLMAGGKKNEIAELRLREPINPWKTIKQSKSTPRAVWKSQSHEDSVFAEAPGIWMLALFWQLDQPVLKQYLNKGLREPNPFGEDREKESDVRWRSWLLSRMKKKPNCRWCVLNSSLKRFQLL